MNSSLREKLDVKLSPLRSFLMGKRFTILIFILACVVTVFSIETYGLMVFAGIICFILIVCEDLMATTLPFLLLAMTLIKCYDSYSTFIGYVWLAVPVVASLLFHFIFYREKIKIGKCVWAILAVSVATTLGGVGFLPLENYISLVGFYYIFGCGFGMLLIYILLSTYIKAHDDYSLSDKLTEIMIVAGLFGVFMIAAYYLKNISTVMDTHSIIFMQWRNNLSTFFMFSMPFAFYKSTRHSYYALIGFLFYGCILLTGSRGGLFFGGVELFICITLLFSIDKKHRVPYLAIIIAIALTVIVYFQDFYSFFGQTFDRFIMGLRGNDKEVRLGLFARALYDFKSNPIFGTGLTYFGNRDVFHNAKFALCWYHCEPLQIIASFGIVGVIAYVYQGLTRLYIMLKRTTVFNIAVVGSYLGVEMMSLVNPGVFCPVPYLFLVTMFVVIVEKCNEKGENETIELFRRKARKAMKNEKQKVASRG
ncbi:MAG: O-antigen ligase family protein [Ruminococcaceae bacterium]|nr:O-antigen ligase family protein [Oscillospiraceae bacterium]